MDEKKELPERVEIGTLDTIQQRFFRAIKAMSTVAKSGDNKFQKYKYSTLSDMYKVIKPALYDEGLYLTQPCEFDLELNVVVVSTSVVCPDLQDSLNYIQKIPTGGKIDPKEIGGLETYGKKYACSGIFCLDNEEDIDAQDKNKGASGSKQGNYQQGNTTGNQVAKPPIYYQNDKKLHAKLTSFCNGKGITDPNAIAAVSIAMNKKEFNQRNLNQAVEGLKNG